MADVLGVSQSAAKMRVSRGLKRLRILLNQSAGSDLIHD
jgi:DNA-directed RNA polymerase specialized sigma24 family protein